MTTNNALLRRLKRISKSSKIPREISMNEEEIEAVDSEAGQEDDEPEREPVEEKPKKKKKSKDKYSDEEQKEMDMHHLTRSRLQFHDDVFLVRWQRSNKRLFKQYID